jgi:hypothetical protein
MGELIESIYAASLDPAAWRTAMQRVHERYGSNMEAFYFLDFTQRSMRLVHLDGVGSARLQDFGDLYFQPHNPWARLTGSLHRPGVVRTVESLASITGDPNSPWRSAYYNEWMRPQRFRHTIGITPYAENGVVANVSLFRPADMPSFSRAEVAEFAVVSRSEALGFKVLNAIADGLDLTDRFRQVDPSRAPTLSLLSAPRVGSPTLPRVGQGNLGRPCVY